MLFSTPDPMVVTSDELLPSSRSCEEFVGEDQDRKQDHCEVESAR